MGKPRCPFSALSLVVLFVVGLCEAASPRSVAPNRRMGPSGGSQSTLYLPNTWSTTLGFLDWVFEDVTDSEIAENAPNYVFLWGGFASSVNAFRDANPNINIGRYTTGFMDDQNARPDSFALGEEGGDTSESRARTLEWWNTEADGVGHPDWVMYQCDGETPAYSVGVDPVANMPLDITNPEVTDWQVRTIGAVAAEQGFTTVSTDLLSLKNFNGQCGVYRGGQWVQLFSGEEADPAFVSAVVDWAGRLREGLRTLPTPVGLAGNLPIYALYPDEDIAALASNLDGLIDEGGFTGHGVGRIYVADETWLHKVRNMIAIQNLGVGVYSVNNVQTFPPTDDIDWILGSYLMAREQSAYLLTTIHYGDVRWPHLPEYDLDIGSPCGPMESSQNVYVRQFTNGLSVVNPSSQYGYTFSLPGPFTDLVGQAVEDEIYLEPMSAKVLLAAGGNCT